MRSKTAWLIILGLLQVGLGYYLGTRDLGDRFFSKTEITESLGSFDERINLLEEKVAELTESTTSAISN